jgi:hypothetical protein
MGSKSMLILGIVFIFLLNVLAIHHYIDSYYYQPNKIINEKDDNSSISSIIRDIVKIESGESNSTMKKQKNNKTMLKVTTVVKAKEQEEKIDNKTRLGNGLLNKLLNEKKENKSSKNKSKNIKITNNKLKEDSKDSGEKNALVVLNLNVNDVYQKGNPIIKKMIQRLNDSRIIKIVIHKYSIKIKNYLKKIKDEIVDYGVDIDDIKVIYKKDENKKYKIKILLTKKD